MLDAFKGGKVSGFVSIQSNLICSKAKKQPAAVAKSAIMATRAYNFVMTSTRIEVSINSSIKGP